MRRSWGLLLLAVAVAVAARRLRAVRLKAVLSVLLFEAGAGFTTRLTELRLRKAADLLAHRDGRISDVAFAYGFNDLPYFNRCFRRRFGLTPTAARGR